MNTQMFKQHTVAVDSVVLGHAIQQQIQLCSFPCCKPVKQTSEQFCYQKMKGMYIRQAKANEASHQQACDDLFMWALLLVPISAHSVESLERSLGWHQ